MLMQNNVLIKDSAETVHRVLENGDKDRLKGMKYWGVVEDLPRSLRNPEVNFH